ncbi:MAG TPA: hypothetical protein VHR86_09350, partial [Armatimonadota bacterium]|nr:hypothetical protein [Armatimonadota bacterium]
MMEQYILFHRAKNHSFFCIPGIPMAAGPEIHLALSSVHPVYFEKKSAFFLPATPYREVPVPLIARAVFCFLLLAIFPALIYTPTVAAADPSERTAYYVSSTHWDREW